MNKTFLVLGISMFSVFLLNGCGESQQNAIGENPESNADVKILQSWQGDYPVSQLNLLPEDQQDQNVGYIGNSESFSSIWSQFKPNNDVPDIDFGDHLVLFARNVRYYNRISIGKVILTNGILDIIAKETMSAMPIEKNVAFSIAVVQRQGITTIRIGEKKIIVK